MWAYESRQFDNTGCIGRRPKKSTLIAFHWHHLEEKRMRTLIRSGVVRMTLAFVVLWATTAAWAVPVLPGTWYEFGFFGPAGTMAFEGMGTAPVGGTMQVGGPFWTFTGAAEIALTDNFSQGDSFSLFDNGNLVGSTPAVTVNSDRDVPAVDLEAALLDPSYSHAVFSLGPGEHSLSIRLDNSPFWAGAGFFKLSQPAVPDGGSHLLLIGLGALALFRRLFLPCSVSSPRSAGVSSRS